MGNNNRFVVLCIWVCVMLLSGCLGETETELNECQLESINALEPDHRVESEAGLTETWNANRPEIRCAGVTVIRRTIHTQGLHMPSYVPAPQLHIILQGGGVVGISIPGCAETYEKAASQGWGWWRKGQQPQQEQQPERHQKIRRIREGEVVAIPTGVPYWTYNDRNSSLIVITLIHTTNNQNQLDRNPRRFYLGGSPQVEHPERQEQERGEARNVFSGFDREFLAEAFNIDEETASRLQSPRGLHQGSQIVRVRGGLGGLLIPREQQQEEEEEGGNALEETICSLKLHQNIGSPRAADFYNPRAGRITTINSLDLPILKWLKLSAEWVVLYRNGIYAPHWNINANSVIYVTRGRGRIQIVNCEGKAVFNGEVERGQLVVVPQNYAVAKQAGSEGLEYIVFKTNDRAMMSPMVGRTSVFRAIPAQVLANAFGISQNQATAVKCGRDEQVLFTPASHSPHNLYLNL